MRILFVVYDNGSYDHHFPMGLGAIGGVLKKEGHEIEVWSQDMHHWPDDYLRIFLDENKFDVLSSISRILDEINSRGIVHYDIKPSNIIIPEKNKKDLYDMPKVIKKKIKFTCVRDIRQVLEIALEEKE